MFNIAGGEKHFIKCGQVDNPASPQRYTVDGTLKASIKYNLSCVGSTVLLRLTVGLYKRGGHLRGVAFKKISFHSVEPGVYLASKGASWNSPSIWWMDGSEVIKRLSVSCSG
jgi:hypothetical protein